MTYRPRRIALAFVLLLSMATAGLAQSTFTPQPNTASTRGGSIIRTQGLNNIYSSVTATVDGVSTPIVPGTMNHLLVAPPHAPGTATVLVTAMAGSTPNYFTATITYVDVPQAGLASPVTVVSRATDGSQSVRSSNQLGSGRASISADGRYVLFTSDSRFSGLSGYTTHDVYRKDMATGELLRAFSCGMECTSASMSADGTRVVTRGYSYASGWNIAVVDAPFTASPVRVDVDSSGNPPASGEPGFPILSGNGRYVAFTTSANLDANPADGTTTKDLFVRDMSLGVTRRWTTGVDIPGADVSADGRFVALFTTTAILPDDVNGQYDVYMLDREAEVFVRLAAHANGPARGAAISADGRTVAFQSSASNLVADDTNGVDDVFVLDVASGAISRVSVSSSGVQSSTPAGFPGRVGLSANGQRVVFQSSAPELTSAPLPAGIRGSFVHDRATGDTMLVSADANGWASMRIGSHAITPDGRGVILTSLDQDLVADDTNIVIDVFRKELPADTPAGSDVPADPVDPATGETPVGLVFDIVTVPGDTSVTVSDTGPALPSGFQLGSQYLDIKTTAVFSGAIRVCADYDPATTSDPAALQLLHYEGGAWVNITTGYDPVAHQVCGETTSLSPFVLATPPPLGVRSLLEEGRVFKAGSTIPIRVQIVDGSGANVSAADLPLVATGVRLVSTQTDWAVPEDPGESNPDRGFTFTDADRGPGYRFNLKTTGFAAGTYALRFTVGIGGPALSVEFQVR